MVFVQYGFNDSFEDVHIKNNQVPQDILYVFVCRSKEDVGEDTFTVVLDKIGGSLRMEW